MRRALQIILPLLMIGSGVYVAAWLVMNRKVIKPTEQERYRPRVQGVIVKLEDYRPVIRAQGTVVPRMEIGLSTEVTGRVISMSPKLVVGGLFDGDDELLRINSKDYELAQRQAYSRINTARAGITNSLAQMSNARSKIAQAEARIFQEETEAAAALSEWRLLGRAGNPPALLARVPQLKEARAALDSAKALLNAANAKRYSDEAELTAAQAAGEMAATNVVRCIVRAPFNGRVASRRVGLGQVVSPTIALAQLQSIDFAEVRLALPLKEFAFLEMNNAFSGGVDVTNGPKVRLIPSHVGASEWAGQVVRSLGEVDSGTRMMAVVAQVKNPYRHKDGSALSFGMFVTAEIFGRSLRDVAVLPRNILREGSTVHVLANGKLHERKVRLVWSTREVAVIEEGLMAGEQVCLTAVDAFVDGMEVVSAEDVPDE
jgi:RND family efflux transporter MFP subunit